MAFKRLLRIIFLYSSFMLKPLLYCLKGIMTSFVVLFAIHVCLSQTLHSGLRVRGTSRVEYDAPNNVTCAIVDKRGKEYTSIAVTVYIDDVELNVKCSSSIVSISVTPSLPDGCHLSNYGVLQLRVLDPYPTTDFVFSVVTTKGNATVPFTFTGKQCEYGINTVFRPDSNLNLTVSYNGTVYFDKNKYTVLCIPLYNYHFSGECLESSRDASCKFLVFHWHGPTLFSRVYARGEKIEGDIESVATHPPVIELPSVLAFPLSDHVFFYPPISGVVESVTITSETHSTLVFNTNSFSLSNPTAGVTNYVITATNSKGTATMNMTVGVTECPEGLRFLCVSDFYNGQNQFFEASSVQGQYVHSFAADQTHCFCSPDNGITIHMGSVDGLGWSIKTPVLVSDSMGVIADYYMPQDKKEDTRHVRSSEVVGFGSTYRYYKGEEPSDWKTDRFNDASWSEGVSEQWGNYLEDHPVLFRKSVDIGDMAGTSVVRLALTVNSNCTVYLNGERVARVLTNNRVSHSKLLPVSLFTKNSVVAVKLEPNHNYTVVFDMSLLRTSSMCTIQSINGQARSNETNPSSFPPESAFQLDWNPEWYTTELPVTLEYSFAHGDMAVVNQVVMLNARKAVPRKFEFQGLIDDEVVTLYSHDSDHFMSFGSEQTIQLENKRFFTSYRFVFLENRGSEEMALGHIRLMFCESLSCKKKWGAPASEMGTILYKKCPMGSVGLRANRCDDVDGVPTWVDDRSTCLASLPQQGVSFVDWTFEVTYLYYEDWRNVREKMIEMLLKHITVFREEISFVLVRDMTQGDIPVSQISVRFVVNKMIGDYVQYSLNKVRDSFDSLVKKNVDEKYESHIVGDVKLRNPVNCVMICIVTVTVLVILVLILALYRARLSLQKYEGKKTLKRKTEENKESGVNSTLLVDAECRVCCICVVRKRAAS